MEGFVLEVISSEEVFKGRVMFSFPHVDPDLDILFEKLTAQIEGCI